MPILLMWPDTPRRRCCRWPPPEDMTISSLCAEFAGASQQAREDHNRDE